MKQRIFCLILILCLLTPCFCFGGISVYAAEGSSALPTALWVEPTEENNIPSRIVLYKENNAYHLYLPGDAVTENTFFSWDGGLSFTDASGTYASGELPVPAPGTTKTYQFSTGGSSVSFSVTAWKGSSDVKAVFIDIDESEGTIADMNKDNNHNTECTGLIFIDHTQYTMPKIKGRGNYSWTHGVEKKPYNVTIGEKAQILGMSVKTKKYSFLANANDTSNMRNKIAYDLALEMGIGLESAFADVWMNGDYLGLYLVTPKTDSVVTDDGFLIENDNYTESSVESGGDPQFRLTSRSSTSTTYQQENLLFTVKGVGKNLLQDGEETPENLKAAAAEIKTFMETVWAGLGAKDGMVNGKHYSEYIDMNSVAAHWLLYEYVKNMEISGSVFLHRDGTSDTDKLMGGPAWDYDNSFGKAEGYSYGGGQYELQDAYGWHLSTLNGGGWFRTLARHEDFMQEVYKVYARYHAAFDAVPSEIDDLTELLRSSAKMDESRTTKETMNGFEVANASTKQAGTEYEQHYVKTDGKWENIVANLRTFTETRSKFFRNNFPEVEPEGYEVTFDCDSHCSVTAFDTKDVSGEGHQAAASALARDENGVIDLSGEGQVNFTVQLDEDYLIDTVTALPAENFKNLKKNDDGSYRLTKVKGPVTVTITTVEFVCDHEFVDGTCLHCDKKAPMAQISLNGCAGIVVYPTQDTSAEGLENPTSVYARNADNGEIDISGDGQINFRLVLPEGASLRTFTVLPTANYKNLKTVDEENHIYRVTKVSGNISITVDACIHQFTQWTLETPAGCTEPGTEKRVCGLCGDEETRETEPIGHRFVNGYCKHCGTPEFISMIDFTKAESADLFSIVNRTASELRAGQGLYMISTKDAMEPANDQLSGASATTPKDLITVPVRGDWTATAKVKFNANGSQGYYEFFGFYAGDNDQNLVGLRAGDSSVQDFIRTNGTITAETDGKKTSSGLKSASTHYFRITKSGTTYTSFWSTDGVNYTQIAVYENTGIDGKTIFMDAYSGLSTGYTYLVESLTFDYEREPAEPVFSLLEPAGVTEGYIPGKVDYYETMAPLEEKQLLLSFAGLNGTVEFFNQTTGEWGEPQALSASGTVIEKTLAACETLKFRITADPAADEERISLALSYNTDSLLIYRRSDTVSLYCPAQENVSFLLASYSAEGQMCGVSTAVKTGSIATVPIKRNSSNVTAFFTDSAAFIPTDQKVSISLN